MSGNNAFPANLTWPVSTTTPVGGSVSGAVTEFIGPFTPNDIGRPIYLLLNAESATTGQITLHTSTDGGTTKYPITVGGRAWADFNLASKTGIISNETVDTPYSTRITYYLYVNISAGNVTYNFYQ